MAKLLCVFSTMSASVRYVDWKPGAGDGAPAQEGESVIVKGGAGVADKNIVTLRGIPTMVTEAQAAMLRANPVFKLHQSNGFVSLEEVPAPPSQETVEGKVAKLEGRDGSAPLVDQDFAPGLVPTTGAAPKSTAA